MSAILLLEIGLNVLVFFGTINIGRRNVAIPLIAMAWVAPYLGGNFIFGLYLPYSPAKALGLGIAVLAITTRRAVPADMRFLRGRVYLYLGICLAVALLGLCLVYLRAENIDDWRQAPWLRALNATGAEVLRWLLLIAPIILATREKVSQRVLRNAIFAGLFYCTLGCMQFAIEQKFSYDPFPIMREGTVDSGPIAQSVMSSGLDTRINSICGEPRGLAAFCSLWFLLTAALGKRIGISPTHRILLEGFFLFTLVLTGSRTGLMILAVVGLVAGVTALFSGARRQALTILVVALLLGGVFGTLVVLQVGSLGSRTANGNPKLEEGEASVTVGGVPVPFEFQDAASIMVLMENPVQLPIGMGPGLWQYYIDPWKIHAVALYFAGAVDIGLNSVNSNLQVISRLSDVGLLGMGVMAMLLVALYRFGKARAPGPLRKEYLLSFAVLVAFSQVPGGADLLAFLMLGASVQVYGELSAGDKTKKRRNVRAQLKTLQSLPTLAEGTA